ncbi:carboxypeptidase-like regulatory domain-containing protein [Flavobacterium sp. MC2016-06]|uniref:carboxypeptidase-like regulatory domain-containing protein n=1 Tax=Flavobacterium sp. MC2016-06 TaxID=2676308 RepID=UPI0012BAF5BD|nr:carboxypeptidase-like regulatory domain-containing protein [Flavobacterium sp. MC2016-06]MBU3859405.1 carboxypeptidase-like regulatory domain-containing protein [Flavobacterium sp. MC2016-06]
MAHKIRISIPEPCHENWLEMSPSQKGRFCSNCQKNVIDFTKASDREIVLAYNENENLCGRFNNYQLNRDLIIPKEKKSLWVIAAASVIAFLGLGNQSAKAQGKPRIEQTDNKQSNSATKVNSDNEIKEFSGVVYDEQKTPLPSTNVIIKGTKNTTQTNFDGTFSIKAKKGDILVFSFLDYNQIEFTITNKTNIEINLKPNEAPFDPITVGYGVIRHKK